MLKQKDVLTSLAVDRAVQEGISLLKFLHKHGDPPEDGDYIGLIIGSEDVYLMGGQLSDSHEFLASIIVQKP